MSRSFMNERASSHPRWPISRISRRRSSGTLAATAAPVASLNCFALRRMSFGQLARICGSAIVLVHATASARSLQSGLRTTWSPSGIVLDELLSELLTEGCRRGLILDVARLGAGARERDVGHAAAHAAVGGIRVDAERGRAGVRRLTDDVGGTGVAEDGELKLALVDDGNDIAPRETCRLEVLRNDDIGRDGRGERLV